MNTTLSEKVTKIRFAKASSAPLKFNFTAITPACKKRAFTRRAFAFVKAQLEAKEINFTDFVLEVTKVNIGEEMGELEFQGTVIVNEVAA